MIAHLRHRTPAYICDRIRQGYFDLTHPGLPWLTRDSIALIEQLLAKTDIGFEWGSGRSTQWFCGQTNHLTSVEDDSGWYSRICQVLQSGGITNVDYQFHSTAGLDEHAASDAPYVRAVEALGDRSLDYALVDGWARDWCALAVIPKLRPGSLLVIDNANWFLPPPPAFQRAPNTRRTEQGPTTSVWGRFLESVGGWRRIWTTDGVSCTLILFKA